MRVLGAAIVGLFPLGACVLLSPLDGYSGPAVADAVDLTLTGTKTVVVTIEDLEAARQPLAYAVPGTILGSVGISYANSATDPAVVLFDDYVFEILQ